MKSVKDEVMLKPKYNIFDTIRLFSVSSSVTSIWDNISVDIGNVIYGQVYNHVIMELHLQLEML